MTDEDLELALADLGAHLAWPETPDLAAAVGRRLASSPTPATPAPPADLAGRVRARIDAARSPSARRGRLGRRPGWRAAAVAAAVLLVAVTLAALPGPRRAIADLLGIGGVRITQGGQPPPPPPSTSRPRGSGLGEGLGLGDRVSPAEAVAAGGRPLPVPGRLGTPDAVWLDRTVPGGAVTVVYRPRPGLPASAQTGVGLLLTSLPGHLEQETLLKKLVGSGTRLTQIQVGPARGLWIEGDPHYLFYVGPDGLSRELPWRRAGNTLLWQRDGLTLRLEAQVDARTAVAIATSLP